MSGCGLHWRPHSEANWEVKAGLLVCWLVGFWAVLFDLVQLFLKRVQVCLLYYMGSHESSSLKWFDSFLKRQYLKMKSCRGPVAACPWHAAVLFKHFHYQKFPALLVWSRCGFLSPLLCPKHVSSDKLSRILNFQWWMGWHRRMVEPLTTLVEVWLISKDHFFDLFWGSWWWGAHTGFWDEFEVIMPFFEVFWGERLWLALTAT